MWKKIGIFLILLSMINIVNAEELYNETYNETLIWYGESNFSEGGLWGDGGNTGSSFIPSLEYVLIDFTNYKIYDTILLEGAMSYCLQASSCGGAAFATKDTRPGFIGQSGLITTKLVPGIVYVDDIFYGYADIGWQKKPAVYSSTQFNYMLNIQSVDTVYANSLSGVHNMTFTYNHTIYSEYLTDYNTFCGYGCGVNTHPIVTGYVGSGKPLYGYGFYNVSYYYNGVLTFTNYTDVVNKNYGRVNFYTNNYNFLIKLSNQLGENQFSYTGQSDTNQTIFKLNGVEARIKLVANGEWKNRTLYNLYPESLLENSFAFDKDYYNLGENVTLNISVNNPNNYKVKFQQMVESDGGVYEDYYLVSNATMSIRPILRFPTYISSLTGFLVNSTDTTFSPDGRTEQVANALYGKHLNQSDIVGNLSIDKGNYSRGETVQIKFNTSVNGKIDILCGSASISYNVLSGNNQALDYYISNRYAFPCYVNLYGYLPEPTIIDYKVFEIGENIDVVFFYQGWAKQGETIEISYQAINATNYLILKDAQGNVKFNYTVSATNYATKSQLYSVTYTDSPGIWNAYLYNSSNLLSSASINISSNVATPTPTATVAQEGSLIDLTDGLSQVVFGKIERNDKNEITDTSVSKLGDKIFSTLLLFCFIVICFLVFSKRK